MLSDSEAERIRGVQSTSINSPTGDVEYAVAVRDSDHLWLHKRIKRTAKGDIFVFWPFGRETASGDIHATYHCDGRFHIKTDNKNNLKSMPLPPQYRPKPDATFQGMGGIVMNPISLDETRSWRKECDSTKFHEVFEINSTDISPQRTLGEFQIEVSVLEPERIDLIADAFKGPLQYLVKHHEFKHRSLWIVASLVRLELLGSK